MFKIILCALVTALRSRRQLALENIALRHQLNVLQRNSKRSRLRPSDRALWAIFSRVLPDWRRHLSIVQPDTVNRWNRAGWRLYWRWKSNPGRGRPKVSVEVRTLIRRMSLENPLWGAPRIHGELLKLGYEICETTIARYMAKRIDPPSQTWNTFIRNHMPDIVAIDFFTVPTAPRYLIRDRDGAYGLKVIDTLDFLDIEQIVTAPRSPWQNGYCERVIGTIRRECLDHVIVLGESHLRRALKEYLAYYHESRTNLGLDKDAPVSRPIQSPDVGPVASKPILGGLHHRYFRQAA